MAVYLYHCLLCMCVCSCCSDKQYVSKQQLCSYGLASVTWDDSLVRLWISGRVEVVRVYVCGQLSNAVIISRMLSRQTKSDRNILCILLLLYRVCHVKYLSVWVLQLHEVSNNCVVYIYICKYICV